MKSLQFEEWIKNPELKKWYYIEPFDKMKQGCLCESNEGFVELCGHSSCPYGRIDTTVCKVCNKIVNYYILK